jgi:hypothetical protein
MATRAPDPSFLPGGSLPWAALALGVMVLWAVTCALYVKARMDLKRARAKAATIARIKDGLGAATAIAPFLGPIVGPIVQGIASGATAFVEPPKEAPPPEVQRRHYAGVGSALYEAIVAKLEAPLVAEIESMALKSVEERERKRADESKKDDRRKPDGEHREHGEHRDERHGEAEKAAARAEAPHRPSESKR